jgi:uncharacterized protein (TIGR02246 family)
MKEIRRFLQWVAVLTVCLISFAGFTFAQAFNSSPSGDAVASESAAPIRALLAQVADAYNRGDASGFSASFTSNGDLITGAGDHLINAAEIESYISQLIAKQPKGTKFIPTATNVRFVRPDIAVLTFDGGWLYPGETAISTKSQGIHSIVAVRDKGVWRVVLFQRTRIDPSLNPYKISK